MAQLRRDYEQFKELDAEVIAIGPEDPEAFKKWWRKHEIPFVGIPDPEHLVAGKLYGQKFKLIRGGRLPALAVIDKAGKLRLMHYAGSTADILTNEKVLSILEELNNEK